MLFFLSCLQLFLVVFQQGLDVLCTNITHQPLQTICTVSVSRVTVHEVIWKGDDNKNEGKNVGQLGCLNLIWEERVQTRKTDAEVKKNTKTRLHNLQVKFNNGSFCLQATHLSKSKQMGKLTEQLQFMSLSFFRLSRNNGIRSNLYKSRTLQSRFKYSESVWPIW